MDTSSPDIHFFLNKNNVKSSSFSLLLSSFSLSDGFQHGKIYKMEFASAGMEVSSESRRVQTVIYFMKFLVISM